MKKGLFTLGAASLVAALALAACSGPGDSSPQGSTAAEPDGTAQTTAADAADVNEDGTVNNPEAVQVDPNKLVFWSLFAGGDGAFMDQIISDYNATGPAKQVQPVMLVWADYYTKLTTAVATGKGPDIGVSHVSKLPELVAKGVVQPIDDYAEAAGVNWADYPQASVDSVTFDGKHYAIPLDTHAEIMYANNDLLEAAGVTTAADGTLDIASVDDLKAVLTKLKASVGDGVTPLALTQAGDDPYRVWWATYFQLGGTQIVSEDGTSVTLDKAKAVQAADFVKSLFDDGFVLPGIADHQKMFQEGQAGLVFAGTWATGAFEQTDGLNFQPQAFPSLFNGSSAAWADSHTLTIPTSPSRTPEETQAAVDFISWVSSQGGVTWAGSGQIPSNSQVTASQAYLDLPFRSSYMVEKDNAVFPPQSENFAAFKETIIRNLDTVWAGQADSTTAIDTMVDELGSDL